MGDTNINYDDKFGFNTFQREICAELGEKFWKELTDGLTLPDMESECGCQCRNMYLFMEQFERMADIKTVEKILCRVRHGLHPSQSAWARDEFLKIGDLDVFLQKHQDDEMNHFEELNREKKDFYGQDITDEVLEFIRQNPSMLAPVRKGNKLYCMAFPCNMNEYLKTADNRMKRYHACHCPFAKESILSDSVVSPVLCHCSLGHVMNFTEAFLGRELEGRVVHSVLNGDMTCEYEITIPEDIMDSFVREREKEMVINGYYNYYRTFSLSGIVGLQEGCVEWIMPKEGKKGPSLAFHVRLHEKSWEEELEPIIEGIRSGTVPKRWIITPDATPWNIISLLESKGFRNLSSQAEGPEPGMLLHKNDFQPYFSAEGDMICRRVRTKEDFRIWVDVVNTALHGWEMIDAEHYAVWLEKENLRFYLCEMDGKPVSTASTIRTGDTASLEFVSTLQEYRRRKAAISLCSQALGALFENGVRAVTLSGSEEAVELYRKLGFHDCFHNIIMQYDIPV